ncbi:hypothetical protein FB566_4329 [Stackebrandtia endophytica]|uniref:Uncharacterized protein n=2 Tax=Stackebrandtia endophytica TaxID=1496996 RepID=A0A543B1P1_9ACTN|nr:hypothetical protein FB566_4329 [Stackebrandtia endophytica]
MAGHTRRVVLLGAAAATLSGCSLLSRDQVAVVDETPVLQPVLDFAADQIARLTAAVDGGAPNDATLVMLRDNHLAHAGELARIIGVDVPEGSADVDGDLLPTLNRLEAEGTQQATDACLETTPEFAVLLGEIAACRASHSDVLGAIGG